MRATAVSSKTFAPSPYTVSVGNATTQPRLISPAAIAGRVVRIVSGISLNLGQMGLTTILPFHRYYGEMTALMRSYQPSASLLIAASPPILAEARASTSNTMMAIAVARIA